MASVVVHVRILFDLAAGEGADHAHQPAADSQRVADVADDEVPRLIARIDLAEEVLPATGRGEELGRVVRVNGSAQGEELVQPADPLQVGGDAGDAAGLQFSGFSLQPPDGGVAAIGDQLGERVYFAAGKGLEATGQPADGAERIDAVTDDDAAGRVALLVQAVDLVAGKSADDHGELAPWEWSACVGVAAIIAAHSACPIGCRELRPPNLDLVQGHSL